MILKSFTLDGVAYSWSRNYTQDVGVFDCVSNDQLVDRKLARQIKSISESACHPSSSGCDFRNVTVTFHYSEIKAVEVELKNSL